MTEEKFYRTLSNLQFPMVQIFASGAYLNIEEAQKLDQRPFRSMLVRRWIAYRSGRGFHITPEGKRAFDIFLHSEIRRKNPTLPLTAYFDPTAYGLRDPLKKANVHVMPRRRVA